MTEDEKDKSVHELKDMTVEEVSLVDRAANKWKFLITKNDGEGTEIIPDNKGGYVELNKESEKAVWSQAYINTLPDSAFLYIKPGGEKDEEGKTVPRTNRMFPYRDDRGRLDLPHLRNAIARIPQANIPQDLKDKLQNMARGLLEQTKKAKVIDMIEKFTDIVKNSPKVEIKLESTELLKLIGDASEKLSKVFEILELKSDEVNKQDIANSICEVLGTLISTIKLSSCTHDKLDKKESDTEKSKDDSEKSKDDSDKSDKKETDKKETDKKETDKKETTEKFEFSETVSKLENQLNDLSQKFVDYKKSSDDALNAVTDAITNLAAHIKKNNRNLSILAPKSNRASIDIVEKKSDEPFWPRDMAEYVRQNEEKDNS